MHDYSHKRVGEMIEEVISMPPDALGTEPGEAHIEAFVRKVKADAALSGVVLGNRIEVTADHARNCCVLTANVAKVGEIVNSEVASSEVVGGGDAAAPSPEPRFTEDGALRHPEDLDSITGGTPVPLSAADLVEEVAAGGEDAGGVSITDALVSGDLAGAGPDVTAADAGAAEPA